MKKYYQTALALTAVISVVTLLFYRHEYNKLRFVLQVFNSFGTTAQKNDNCTFPIEMRYKYESRSSSPESAWQRLSDHVYVYSAYNNNNREIRAIGFGKNSDDLKYSCYILYDNHVESFLGEFSYEIIDDDNDESVHSHQDKYIGFLFSCKITETIEKIIVGVQFKNAQQNKYDSVPIIHVHTLKSNVNSYNNVICVAPPTDGLLKHVNLISFLAFHHYIGWNNFLVYDFGISHMLSTGLRNFSEKSKSQGNFTYITIPWNFPYGKISHNTIRKIIQTDCIYRTYNEAIMTITLSWNEYINLRFHNTIENVLSDIAHENGQMEINKFRLNTLIFCKNNVDDESLSSLPTLLKTTRSLKKISENAPHYIYKRNDIVNPNVVQQDISELIIISRYQVCLTEDKREIVANRRHNLAEHTPNTKLFQYYISGKLFDH